MNRVYNILQQILNWLQNIVEVLHNVWSSVEVMTALALARLGYSLVLIGRKILHYFRHKGGKL